MADFSESRTRSIDGYIITISNLQNLANYVFSDYKKHSDNNHGYFSIDLERQDGATLESASPSILDEVATIAESRIIGIHIMYINHPVNHRISIHIRHHHDISLKVEGKDRNWVNGQISILEGIIRGFEAQKSFIKRFRFSWLALLSVVIGFGLLDIAMSTFGISVWNNSVDIKRVFSETSILRLFSIACTSAIVGVIPASAILAIVERKLWPSVEIQVGPEHSFSEKNLRRRASWMVFVVIPVIVGLAGLAITISR